MLYFFSRDNGSLASTFLSTNFNNASLSFLESIFENEATKIVSEFLDNNPALVKDVRQDSFIAATEEDSFFIISNENPKTAIKNLNRKAIYSITAGMLLSVVSLLALLILIGSALSQT